MCIMGTEKNSNLANFYLELMDLNEQLAAQQWPVEITKSTNEQWLTGTPLLTIDFPEVPSDLLREVMEQVLAACLKWQPGPQSLPQQVVTELVSLNINDTAQLVKAALKNVPAAKKQWADRLGLTSEMMDFLTFNMARPILASYGRAAVEQLDLERWTKGYCPVCGESPVMAKLTGKYGVRMLHCGRCETEWRYARLGCPYCDNKDSAKLSFITIEGYKQYRLYLCEQCKSYLKTVDERQCGEVDLFCEDLATKDLDLLANHEGYQRSNKRHCV